MPEPSQGATIAPRKPWSGFLAPSVPGLLAAAFLLGLLVFTVHAGAPPGALNDADSYMQIVHFRYLLAGGGEHGALFMRDNAPYGMVLHWSRAYDLLVFALAAPLAAVLGWAEAISWIGPFLGPIWTGVLIIVGVWAIEPVCAARERVAVGIALAWTPIPLVWGAFGNADHHVAVLIAWVALMGFALRVAAGGANWRQGAGAGLAAAGALWLNVDCILPVGLGLAVMGLAWIRDGGARRPANLAAAAGFALALTAALAVGPPQAGWRAAHLDRLSIVYVVFALLVAGLWLAPLVETHLPGLFAMLLLMPLLVLATAWLWHCLPQRLTGWLSTGWEAALLVPVLLGAGYISLTLSPVLEKWLFGGDMPAWLQHELGMGFDQRNSLVVGLAMGFAVIPTIFSISEDAIFSVPRHLTSGSLALGATSWQTLVRVVLLTASPGIFSGIMMGVGRAVGETMIVLMATGNTPVMDLSIFQGMRTLSANIAVEMPEAAVASTHYRVLFLAALVLFLFTFVFNTGAELIRQRLRNKYSSL